MATRYYQELLNFCARTLKDRDAALDTVQEAYARFLGAQQSGHAIADPRALLFRTTRNLMIDQHRRAEHRDHQSLQALLEHECPAAPDHCQPEEILASKEHAQALCAAIDSLPERCKQAFVLNRFEGLTHQEVAEKMGISRNMVAQHIMRGVLVCKACDERFKRPNLGPRADDAQEAAR